MFVLIGSLVGLGRAGGPPETDAYWSARYGLDFLSTGRLLRHDTYSWTAAGRTWIPNSWGWNVVLGILDRSFGIAGFTVLVVLLGGAVGLAIAASAARLGAAPFHTAVVFIVLAPLVLIHFPRAESLSCIAILAFPPLLDRIMTASRGRAVRYGLVLVAVELVWVNLHSFGYLGPVLVGAAGVLIVVQGPHSAVIVRRRLARLSLAVGATAGACLVTPYGISGVLHVPAVRQASAGLIREWDHPGIGTFGQVLGLMAMLIAALAAWIAWRQGQPAVTGVLIVLGLGDATAIRFMTLVAVSAAPVLALGLTNANIRPQIAQRMTALGCVVLAGFAINGVRVNHESYEISTSPALVDAIPAGCKVVNDYQIGGAIILRRPDVRVSLDGRNDMYGRHGVVTALDLLKDRPGTLARLDAAGVNCVLAHTDAALVTNLSANPEWHDVRSDGVRTLLVRDSR